MSSIVKVDTIQENTSANGITVDGLNIKDSKLVTANSVVAANVTADAINGTKIADGSIENEHLNVLAVTGHTAETSIADGDTILIHDASASALRKMTKANFVSGIGGANTPIVRAVPSGSQTISASTNTTVVFNTEVIDTDSAFASNTFTVPSGKAGKYYASATLLTNTAANNSLQRLQFKKNSSDAMYGNYRMVNHESNTITIFGIVDLAEGDTLKVNYYSYQQTSEIYGNDNFSGGTSINIFKLI